MKKKYKKLIRQDRKIEMLLFPSIARLSLQSVYEWTVPQCDGRNEPPTTYRGMEKRLSRQAHNLKIGGSIPSPATNFVYIFANSQ